MLSFSWGAFLIYLTALVMITLGGIIGLIESHHPAFLAPILKAFSSITSVGKRWSKPNRPLHVPGAAAERAIQGRRRSVGNVRPA